MMSQISFGNQLEFFISIDRMLSNTLAVDQEEIELNDDECHSSTKASIPPKKDGKAIFSL